jgi:O-antigen/teichoic acid export membrane protein
MLNKIYKYFLRLRKHPTMKNTFYLTLGGIISQLISLIGLFYIPNLLGLENYGIFQIVMGYVSVFAVFTFNGVNKIILRESSRDLSQTKDIIECIIGFKNLCSIISIFISIGFLFFMNYDNTTNIYIALFSITLLINGLNGTVSIIYQAFEKMKPIAIFNILGNSFRVLGSIFSLMLGYGVLSLILIQLVVNLIILLVNYRYSKKYVKFNILSKVTFVKAYIRQGFTFSLIGFFNTLAGNIDIVMLSILTTPVNVGIYALAYRIVQKGLIIRGPISTSLFPFYTKKYEKEPIKMKQLIQHTLIIIIPSIVILLCVLFSSEFIIITFIGNEFIESAKILNVLTIYLIFNYSVIPWGILLQSSNNEGLVLKVVIVKAILNIMGNIILFYKYGLIGIAYSTLINEGVGTIMQVYYTRKKITICV